MDYKKRDRDEFLKVYYEFIAKATHSAFIVNYPTSRGLHDPLFQKELYDVLFHLLSGN
jgi:hypothetical protein